MRVRSGGIEILARPVKEDDSSEMISGSVCALDSGTRKHCAGEARVVTVGR